MNSEMVKVSGRVEPEPEPWLFSAAVGVGWAAGWVAEGVS